ncbi:hypothetical protein [Azospirillum largimobile]
MSLCGCGNWRLGPGRRLPVERGCEGAAAAPRLLLPGPS